jgi:hypothetical protein
MVVAFAVSIVASAVHPVSDAPEAFPVPLEAYCRTNDPPPLCLM